jgi:hypothetical protein
VSRCCPAGAPDSLVTQKHEHAHIRTHTHTCTLTHTHTAQPHSPTIHSHTHAQAGARTHTHTHAHTRTCPTCTLTRTHTAQPQPHSPTIHSHTHAHIHASRASCAHLEHQAALKVAPPTLGTVQCGVKHATRRRPRHLGPHIRPGRCRAKHLLPWPQRVAVGPQGEQDAHQPLRHHSGGDGRRCSNPVTPTLEVSSPEPGGLATATGGRAKHPRPAHFTTAQCRVQGGGGEGRDGRPRRCPLPGRGAFAASPARHWQVAGGRLPPPVSPAGPGPLPGPACRSPRSVAVLKAGLGVGSGPCQWPPRAGDTALGPWALTVTLPVADAEGATCSGRCRSEPLAASEAASPVPPSTLPPPPLPSCATGLLQCLASNRRSHCSWSRCSASRASMPHGPAQRNRSS